MAAQLQVSRGSVVSAYEQLVGEGYLETTKGGTRVVHDLRLPHASPKAVTPSRTPQKPLKDLRPGQPDPLGLTTTWWRTAWRRAAAHPQAYPAPGSARLRSHIADHLRLTRSLQVDPDALVITSGARDGLTQLLRVLDGPVAIADPGYPTLQQIPHKLGKEVVRFNKDTDAKVILVMPNHQYPTGQQMPAAQRLELIEHAKKTGAVIVEDDYDSELRRAHPALAALDPGVAFLGSFAKTLSPAIGLGYLIVPENLRESVVDNALPVSGIVQDAMTTFLEGDGVRHHTAKLRKEYRKRREIFQEVFPHGIAMDGGLNAVVPVDDEHHVVALAHQKGLAVEGLSQYWTSSSEQGIVLGLGTHTDERLKQLLKTLARVIDEA